VAVFFFGGVVVARRTALLLSRPPDAMHPIGYGDRRKAVFLFQERAKRVSKLPIVQSEGTILLVQIESAAHH
jgi:hypothetical protein